MDWYYVADGQQVGPVSEQDLKALVDAGTVTGETLVWHEGMQDWVPQSTVASEITASAERHPAGPGPVAPPGEGTSGLSLKKQEPAPAQAVAAGAGGGICRECGRQFPLDQMVEYEGATICAECKPAFFQRLQEGAASLFVGRGTGGQTANADIMTQARASLGGRWGLVIGFVILFNIVTNAVGIVPYLGMIALLLCIGPFMVGHYMFFLSVARDADPRIGMMFHGFRRFGTAFLGALLFGLFVTLWWFLLFIPAIIAYYRYSMMFYILAEDETVGAMEAMNRSIEMMKGKKWKLFCLHFRFFGLTLLCMLPVMVGGIFGVIGALVMYVVAILAILLWVQPWAMVAQAHFYDDALPPA